MESVWRMENGEWRVESGEWICNLQGAVPATGLARRGREERKKRELNFATQLQERTSLRVRAE